MEKLAKFSENFRFVIFFIGTRPTAKSGKLILFDAGSSSTVGVEHISGVGCRAQLAARLAEEMKDALVHCRVRNGY